MKNLNVEFVKQDTFSFKEMSINDSGDLSFYPSVRLLMHILSPKKQ